MNSASPFASGSIFNILGSIFRKHSIRPVLVGGYAVIAYKIQRMTFDIDFLLTRNDFKEIGSDIYALGYSVFNQSDAFIQLKSDSMTLRDLDFLLSDEKTVDNLIKDGLSVIIAGEKFIVPSPLHLIAMKLHSIIGNKDRELKDYPDIVQLLTVNEIDPTSDIVKQLFAKYNAMELYEQVLKTTNH